MSESIPKRKLVAILAADVVGYGGVTWCQRERQTHRHSLHSENHIVSLPLRFPCLRLGYRLWISTAEGDALTAPRQLCAPSHRIGALITLRRTLRHLSTLPIPR